MKKFFLPILLFLIFTNILRTQTLISTYEFPNYNKYNSFWGIAVVNDTFRIGSDFDGTIYKVTKTGNIRDSLSIPLNFNHGVAFDGTNLWIAEYYQSSGGRIFKINFSGQILDTIQTGTYAQGIGGIAISGNFIWFTVYYPDNTTYPFAYAYKMNLTTKTLVDTIPLRGKQVQGIAIKGDTVFYVNDNFQGDAERIYAYRKVVNDTIFSLPVPDPDGDCNPKGMTWDGQNLWLIADRVGGPAYSYKALYKYALTGQGNPIITTSTNSVDFGNTVIGTTGNQPLQISNTGTAKLIITGKNISSPRFGITPNTVPDTINPGQFKNYTLTFAPLVFDTISAQLHILSNDAATPDKIVSLTGKGVFNGAAINLSATNYNYNSRRVNSLCGYKFIVQNQGNAALQLTSASFTGLRYKIDTVGTHFPLTINAQASREFRVWFNPNSATTFNDSLTIISNAVNLPTARILFSGTGITVNSNLGDILWQGICPDNPFTSYNDYQPVSIKQIGDVNGDGINDVVVASNNYLTTCYNGNSSVTSDILWMFNTGYNNNNTGSVTWEDAMQIRDDVDGDGIQDVVIGCAGGNEMVYTISGRTGQQIWTWGDSITYSDGDIEEVKVDRDYNGDGIKDVLVSASGSGNGAGRHSVVCLNGLNGQVIFNVTQPCEFTGDVVATSFGGAIGRGNNSGSYSVNGFDNSGNATWSYTVDSKTWNMKEIPSINTDTVKEIVGLTGFSGNVFCVAENDGSVNWTLGLGSSNNGRIILLDDLDSNGYIDLTLSGPTSVYRIDSKTHNIIWSVYPGGSFIRGIDFISDVNGDGRKDIAIATQQPGKVMILSGVNGSTLFEYTFGSSIDQRGDRVSALQSIDGNSTTELVGGCRDGRVICFSGGQNVPVGIHNISSVVPKEFSLLQNNPNPFNPVTTIKFNIPKLSDVKLIVYDILGKEVSRLVNTKLAAGSYTYNFNATNLSSGVYFYKIEAGNFSDIKKMVVIK